VIGSVIAAPTAGTSVRTGWDKYPCAEATRSPLHTVMFRVKKSAWLSVQ
jgi:hypothetical protein